MKKGARIFFIVTGLTVMILSIYVYLSKEKTEHWPESEDVIMNPDRGFYVQMDADDVDDMQELDENQISLVLLAYDIGHFQGKNLSEEKLGELENALGEIQKAGKQVIFRAAYGFHGDTQEKDPTDLKQILAHIRQIAPILNEYKGDILIVQAGFLGAYGEWHHSNLLSGDRMADRTVRNSVLHELAEDLDEEIRIAVRTPEYIRDGLEDGIPGERLSLHNDAFLSTKDDMGTYIDEASRDSEIQWMRERMPGGIHGGEMPKVSQYTEPGYALTELEGLGVTYLNFNYNKEVIDGWQREVPGREKFFDYIAKRLGYRFSITALRLQKTWPNPRYHIELQLKNTGLANIKEGYHLYWAVKSEESLRYMEVGVAPEEIDAGEEIKLYTSIAVSGKSGGEIGLVIAKGNPEEGFRTPVKIANDKINFDGEVNYFFHD